MNDPLDLTGLRAYREVFADLLPSVQRGQIGAVREARRLFDELEAITLRVEAEAVDLGANGVRLEVWSLVEGLAGGVAISAALDVAEGHAEVTG